MDSTGLFGAMMNPESASPKLPAWSRFRGLLRLLIIVAVLAVVVLFIFPIIFEPRIDLPTGLQYGSPSLREFRISTVQRYLPEFEKRWRRYARPIGGSWRMDETYIKVHGQWVYLYRAVDKAGQTVDFFLSWNRDVNAAKSFLRSAMKNTRVPTKITLDAYAASHRAVRETKEDSELPGRVQVRSSQYLNNLVEQDHRRAKQRIRPMLGFKRFANAVVTISGIELAEKIKKGQFKTGKLGGRKATMTELWNAALAA